METEGRVTGCKMSPLNVMPEMCKEIDELLYQYQKSNNSSKTKIK